MTNCRKWVTDWIGTSTVFDKQPAIDMDFVNGGQSVLIFNF